MVQDAWRTWRIWTPGIGCPVAEGAQATDVDCFDPGTDVPIGRVRGPLPEGWRAVLAKTDGSVVAEGSDPCRRCPLRLLPEDVTPYAVHASRNSVTFCIHPGHRQLQPVLAALADTGQRPVVVRSVSSRPDFD